MQTRSKTRVKSKRVACFSMGSSGVRPSEGSSPATSSSPLPPPHSLRVLKDATRFDFALVFQGVCTRKSQNWLQIRIQHEKTVQNRFSKSVYRFGPKEVPYPIPSFQTWGAILPVDKFLTIMVMLPGFAIVLHLQVEVSGVCNTRSLSNKKITIISKPLQ